MSAMPIDGLVIDSRFYPLLNAYLACLSPPVEIRKRIAVLSVFSIYVTFLPQTSIIHGRAEMKLGD
jgi:hypothetical protein